MLLCCLGLFAGSRAGDAAEASPASLEALGRQMMSDGLPNRIPSPIAEALGLEPDAPVHYAGVSQEQASDRQSHSLSVLVEVSTTTPRRAIRPVGVVFLTDRIVGRQSDSYYYRSSVDGTLDRAIFIDGQVDEAGRGVKGSGKITQEDIGTPAVKKRFQHEIDLWLKRRYLKKEWRNAEFSGGVLKKKAKAP